ncbi:MAG TPA: DUF1858 domain-containing protein [Firmicutes bacterium]|jgi:hypothetical protein|nr:MAG: hypothetical protein AA931_04685 [Peptococcaceae bacterium 1109]HHT73058.1 DUF1858 domain-containing protein [Bacillota bacterium]
MEKVIDLRKSVYDICQAHPEAVEILAEVGFSEIAKPGMLATVGRVMTIPKGARMRGIKLDKIIAAFEQRGYEVIQ